ncbi:Shedu anti-phage system protein SduA domain-containing protein [Micromonospora sp. NPDC005215]|uniref:Shedu anti-phage system protein SduA domain-containing protein n=1 Tax=Micromonospora sp. NPDC005215 TaxID=3157024 RepID=UPI0033AAAC18
MPTRSDLTLRLFLEKIIELGVSDHVRSLLDDALRHMGKRSPYRGGRDLVDLLRYAGSAAKSEDDLHASKRIEDALAYSMYVMLRPDLEIKYQLFPGSRLRYLGYIRSTVEDFGQLFLTSLRQFNADQPDASPDEIYHFLDGLFASARSIEEDEQEPGRYRMMRGPRESSAWLREALLDRLDIENLSIAVGVAANHHQSGSATLSLAELVQLSQLKIRSDALQHLRCVVQNPHSTEGDLQHALARNLWIFGGSYLQELGRRRLVPGNELDISLVRPDGSIHVVELKRANLGIVTHQRGNVIPNSQVHRAVGQTMNYLLALDEDRPRILNQHGVDVRRAGATVIIGHPDFQPDVEESELNDVLRTYSSHLARIEVITYKQLLDGAARALDFS